MLMNEPYLMPKQDQPFNGDQFICAEFLRLRDKFKIKTAVELGSCVGGTAWWLAENFERVITIEVNSSFRNFCLERIRPYKNIQSYLGDTLKILPLLMESIGNDSIWFIDSHWGLHCPIQNELSIIANAGIRPVIAIHDFVVPATNFGYDAYNGQAFTFEWLQPYFDNIYGPNQYEYFYNTEATEDSARRGIIYLTPK